MRVAKAKGHLRGRQPKLNPRQEAHLVELFGSGDYTTAEVGDLFGVARSTVFRAVERSRRPKPGARPPTRLSTPTTRASDAQGQPGGADNQPATETPAVVYRPQTTHPACCQRRRIGSQRGHPRSTHPRRQVELTSNPADADQQLPPPRPACDAGFGAGVQVARRTFTKRNRGRGPGFASKGVGSAVEPFGE